YIILLIASLYSPAGAYAQLDSVTAQCNSLLTEKFISDGQQYLSLVSGDQKAEFPAVFYGGNTYKIIACGGNSNKDIIFTVYDRYRNILFTNKDYDNTNYWNFQFESTVECFIEAEFAPGGSKSGFVLILIGLEK
ncbi:MAG: hypothetical protein GXO50_07570, partial [Chlorobi bacterium]|nr:hypothetical protein [Chlorobiota bacterium]